MPYDDDGDYYDYNNGYDDDYSDDYEPDPWCEGYNDEEAIDISYYYDQPGPGTPLHEFQAIVWRIQYRINQRLDYVRRWLKWHNHKCTVCGKPAIADGEICPSCYIPF